LSVQRCGGEVHAGCPCGETDDGSPAMIQRDVSANPADLAGSVFEKLDDKLKVKLADKNVFPWSKPTLAASLNELPNAVIAIMSRIGAMVSKTAPFLWDFVAKIEPGGWITDNFGMPFTWTDGAALGAKLAAEPTFCKDNPASAWWYHNTTSAYRQIAGTPGGAALHVITAGKTEVHIDVHQPVKGKDKSWLSAGQCEYDLSAWWDHAGDVTAGKTGARATPIGRYGTVRGGIDHARKAPYYREDKDEPQLTEAENRIKAVSMRVQKYAAMGAMVGNEWAGDQEMLKDPEAMSALEHGEEVLRSVELAQVDRRSPETPAGP
jgi:hypothetical protein